MKKTENTDNAPKKAGRPASPITWPTGKFTVTDALANAITKNGTKLCELQMRNRIRQAINDGTVTKLEGTKKETEGVGRPKTLYARTTQVEAWKNLSKSRQGQKSQKTEETAPESAEVTAPEPAEVTA